MFEFLKLQLAKKFYFSMQIINELTTIRKSWKSRPGKEIGGFLFGKIGEHIMIESIVEIPNKYKIMAGGAYDPDRVNAIQMISKRKLEGFDLIGEWHTHPSGRVMPSSRDEEVMFNKVNLMKDYMFMIMTESNMGMWYYKKGKKQSEQIL